MGLDLPVNNNSNSYIAFVTFGDGSTANIAIADTSLGGGFWGITDSLPIASIHFGRPDGADRTSRTFSIDNLTIGAAAQVLPEPSVVLLFGVGLAGLAFAIRGSRERPGDCRR